MRTALPRALPRASETNRPNSQLTDQLVASILTDIVLVLWPPPNTAPQVAAVIGCSVRQAERFLSGKQKWSGDAVAAVVAEILRRHRMRNVKVLPR